jgi:GTP-binding protein
LSKLSREHRTCSKCEQRSLSDEKFAKSSHYISCCVLIICSFIIILSDDHDIRNIERFLLEQTDETFAYGYKGSLLARLAVAALHINNHELARKAINVRRKDFSHLMLPMESAAIIRGLLRVHNVTDALEILYDELSIPIAGSDLSEPANQDRIKHHALSLASLCSRHFFEREPSKAVLVCKKLAEIGPIVRESGLQAEDLNIPWARILRGAGQCESGRRDGSVTACKGIDVEMPCNVGYSVLNAMATFPSENSDRVYELLSNVLVRRILFITGAIDMNGCPPADRAEAVFIGRSNVGKSSLVNMVTNRKSLAFTSKRPGKTQQFNFFAVNDKPGREKEVRYGDEVPGEKDLDSFYIVDVPGFGYAKVPEHLKKNWAEFMKEYISKRETLKVLFHLVDGRHGPSAEDASIMKQISESLPSRATYVVLLTKADKNVKSASTTNSGKVSSDVMNRLRDAMKENGVGNAPVILTSAETKLGRDDIWRFLKLAAEA